MNRPRTHITNQRSPPRIQVTLDVEVPVHDNSALGVLLHIPVTYYGGVEADVGVRDSGAQRRIRVVADDLERKGSGSIEAEFVGQGKDVEHAKGAADRGLPILAGIVGKTDTRLEILKRRIRRYKAADMDRSTRGSAGRAIHQSGNFLDAVGRVVGFGGHLVPQAKVYRQVRAPAPATLQHTRNPPLAHPS